MPKSLVPLLVTLALLPVALMGAGCGGDDNSKSDNGSSPSSSAKSTTPVIPTNAERPQGRVREGRPEDGRVRVPGQAQLHGAAPKSVNSAARALEKTCEQTAQELPAGSERTNAIKECKSSLK